MIDVQTPLTVSGVSIETLLQNLGLSAVNAGIHTGTESKQPDNSTLLPSISPINNKPIAEVQMADVNQYQQVSELAQQAFLQWRLVPAPVRGEVVRQIGAAFRKYKNELGYLVSLEMGKIYQEGKGEVQEIIDICDFACGLSRQLYGLTMPSERPAHRLQEVWHPLGVVGVISAFNFPVAVWAWNAMLAAVCGNTIIWKPSEKTPLCAIACQQIISQVLKENQVPEGVFNLVCGDAGIGAALAADKSVALVSATGSTAMGRAVAAAVAARLGKYLLELGGNNAIIISPHADLKLAIQATVFAAVGTTGQRCTTCRRLIVHESIYETVKQQLMAAYQQLFTRVGNPLDENTLIGPLIDSAAVEMMQQRLAAVAAEGGKLLLGGEAVAGEGNYVLPALVEATPDLPSVQHETFAPILYLLKYQTIEEAIAIQNNVPQGLSSAIFSNHVRETELFLSAAGSDCGIANVNIGTSGAEIGGAFGGEKETGGGRESGSDSWKAYMRRQTVTINYSDKLPLAQGISFNF